jgi:hypothetical protein
MKIYYGYFEYLFYACLEFLTLFVSQCLRFIYLMFVYLIHLYYQITISSL